MCKGAISPAALVLALGLAAAMGASPLQQDLGPDGIVSVEAEHYDNKTVGDNGDEWIEVAQAAGGVAARGVPDGTIRLLPHLKKTVQHVLGIGIVR